MKEDKISVPPFRERINYIITENCIVGASVNMPLTCQGDTIDEIERKMKIMAQIHIDMLQETLNSEHPFEFKQLTQEEWRKQR